MLIKANRHAIKTRSKGQILEVPKQHSLKTQTDPKIEKN